jgi:hypothetical protein
MLSRKTHTDIAAIRVIALYVREVSEATWTTQTDIVCMSEFAHRF